MFQRFIAILGVLQITIGSIPPSIHASQIVPEVNLSRIYSERPRNSVVFQRQPRGQGLRTLPTQSVHGVVISVDTRDEKACEQVRRQLLSQRKDQSNDEVSALRDLCLKDKVAEAPVAEIVLVRLGRPEPDEEGEFFGHGENLSQQIRDFSVLGAGTMVLIASLPRSISNWDDNALANPFGKWRRNVSEAPVIDKDHWAINYIGHPVSGAAYYVVGRRSGLSPKEAFGFSVAMSTFWWEYGFEAVAEKPSIQDLFLTPVMGSLLGELMYSMNSYIRANDGQLAGSRRLGRLAEVATDPATALMRGLNQLFDRPWIDSAHVGLGMQTLPKSHVDYGTGTEQTVLQLRLNVRFW